MLRFCFFLLRNNTKDVYWDQCFQMSLHACAQKPFMFLIPGSVLAATAQQHWMQRYQSCICHQKCLQIMAEDKDLNQDLVKAGWCSPVTSLGWSESTYCTVRVIHCMNCTLVRGISHVCKFTVHIWELNYCIPSVKYLYLLWKSVSECMCTVVRHWWGGGDNSDLPECHILSVTEERMCQQGYGSSALSLSKSIKCKTKLKAEFKQYSVQSQRKWQSEGCCEIFPSFFFLFCWENKNKICRQTVLIPELSRNTQQWCLAS